MAEAIRVHNRRGELVEAPQYTATEAKHKFGQLLDSALREGPVAIIKQRKPAANLGECPLPARGRIPRSEALNVNMALG